jgi:hypothetical protein
VIEMRLRRRSAPSELEAKQGKILGTEDYNMLLTGPAYVRMPDNRPLCVYLPGVLTSEVDKPGVYEILTSMRAISKNRGLASGAPRLHTRHPGRSYAREVASTIVGAVDPIGQTRYCRLTAWTGRNLPQWEQLIPLLQAVAEKQRQYVYDRATAQQAAADSANPAWIVPGTPFSTVTVNNTYPTGTHTDKGDLDAGFSTIACLRRGDYSGGHLVFPEYRVAVDMHHGDLLLMDAHQWHGNTALVCACGREPNGSCDACGAERISLVAYFRTRVADCGTPEEELRRADNGRA